MKTDTRIFYERCLANGLTTTISIADAFSVGGQTVRNWLGDRTAKTPLERPWVWMALVGYEHLRQTHPDESPMQLITRIKTNAQRMDFERFEDWCQDQNLGPYREVAGAFGLTKQAVNQWFRRNRIPAWIPLAMLGYEQCQGEKPDWCRG